MTEARIEVSVVVPVFNEAENIRELYAQLTQVLDGGCRDYEVLFVDDGSTDGSYEAMVDLHAKDQRVKVIRLARNFGQHAALSAGIERARGLVLVSLDADLQNDPRAIPRLLAKIDEGYDVVSGWRVGRKEGLLTRRLPSWLVNKTIALITGVQVHDATCPLKAVRREVFKDLSSYGEMRRFLAALVLLTGRSYTEVPIEYRPRAGGRSKYSFFDLIGGYVDLITAFWPRLFQVVVLIGLLCLTAGFLGGLLYVLLRFFIGASIGARSQVMVFLVVFVGFQFMILGFLGEFTARIYRLVQDRPLFIIKETLE